MSLHRFNYAKESLIMTEISLENLEDIENLVNVVDIVFPGIRDNCRFSLGSYYPDELQVVNLLINTKRFLIPRRVQFKNKGLIYDDNVFEIKREAELQRYKRWKRTLSRKSIGNYGII